MPPKKAKTTYHDIAELVRTQEALAHSSLYDIPSLDAFGDTCSLDELMKERKIKRPSLFDKPLAPQITRTRTLDDGKTEEMTTFAFARAWVWDFFEAPEGSVMSSLLNGYIMVLICTSGVIAVIETEKSLRLSQAATWYALETFFVINFTIEFMSRFLSCSDQYMFWTSGMNYVDLVAIAPFYLDLIISTEANANYLRILRLGRAFRLMKLSRYSSGMRLVKNALEASWDALQLFFMILVLVLVVFSSAIYYMERGDWDADKEQYFRNNEMPYYTEHPDGENPQDPSPFQSIPQSFWWCMVTLTTVGYGDVVPVTYVGQVVATATMLVGLIMLALPLSIIGTNFIEERNKIKEQEIEERNALVPQKEEDKVKPLQGSSHALIVAETCIQQAMHTVELQHEMQQLMQKALGIVDAMRLSSDLENGSPGRGVAGRGSWTPPIMTPKAATSLLGFDSGNNDSGPPCMVKPSVLEEMESLCAQVIDMSQKTVDVWEGDAAPPEALLAP